MSATTTTVPAKTDGAMIEIENAIIAVMPLLSVLMAGKLTPLNVTIQDEIKNLSDEAKAFIVEAKAALDGGQTSHPALVKVESMIAAGLTGMGISLPDENTFFTHMAAVVTDLAAAVSPAAA